MLSLAPRPTPRAAPARTTSSSSRRGPGRPRPRERRRHEIVLRGHRLERDQRERREESGAADGDASLEAEAPRRPVHGHDDRELREVLGNGEQPARPERREQEEDLLLGERLEHVHPVGRRVRDPDVAAVLRPGPARGQVVGERVPVVRRHGQREQELVAERHAQHGEEEHRQRAAEDVASGAAGGPQLRQRAGRATTRRRTRRRRAEPSVTASGQAFTASEQRESERDGHGVHARTRCTPPAPSARGSRAATPPPRAATCRRREPAPPDARHLSTSPWSRPAPRRGASSRRAADPPPGIPERPATHLFGPVLITT